jgi:hypothetical protein
MGRILPAAIIGATGIILVVLFSFVVLPSKPGKTQPLAYNHKAHIEQAGLTCLDCHAGVESAARATIPPLEVCRNCHSSEPISESPEEQRLIDLYTSTDTEIGWERVYSVPDHVFFSHRRHVVGGELECRECHGNVAEMANPVSLPVIEPTMENCMNCHRQNKVTNDCLSCHR